MLKLRVQREGEEKSLMSHCSSLSLLMGVQTNAMDVTLFAAGTEKWFQMTHAKGLQFQGSTCQEGHSLLPS